MLVGTYSFRCRFTSRAVLPEFKGSTIRGAFGHALKRICCALRHRECGSCLLFETCAYAFLFEVKKVLPSASMRRRFAHRPHPYVIVPPDEPKRVYEEGAPFSFDFILFGRANDYLPHILYAVRHMGESGLGKKEGAGGRFEIETVRHDDQTIFADDSLNQSHSLHNLSLEPIPSAGVDTIVLVCRTPLRLKYANVLQDSLPFHLVIRAALRRISSVEAVYGDGEPDLDYRGMAARAVEVRTTESDCRWMEIERFSSRQRNAMLFGGIRGRIVYAGRELGEFLPLLHYCAATHLGKQTSFGLGRIAIQNKTET